MTILHALVAAVLALAPAPTGAAEVVHDWDDRRSAAWAAGDVAALRSLYTRGSAAGRADAAMLRAWQARGLRVVDLRMQLLTVETRRRTPDRLVLAVTDRLAGGVAMPGRLPLPRDRPSERVVTLRLVAGEWLVAQAKPVRITSSTVRSANR